jgi:DNA-binding transcriptional LysR family regulator
MNRAMSTQALFYALAVAQDGSISRAAKRLHVSQSAFTRQIQQLEGDLKFKLFLRLSSGTQITPAGEVFFAEAMPSLRRLKRARDLAQQRARSLVSPFRVGYSSNLASDILTILPKLRFEKPDDPKIKLHSMKLRMVIIDCGLTTGGMSAAMRLPSGRRRFKIGESASSFLPKRLAITSSPVSGVPSSKRMPGRS